MSSFSGNAPAHKHCPVCGKSMPVDKNFCSPDCEQEFSKRRRSQQRRSWIFIGVLIALMALWLLFAKTATPVKP